MPLKPWHLACSNGNAEQCSLELQDTPEDEDYVGPNERASPCPAP